MTAFKRKSVLLTPNSSLNKINIKIFQDNLFDSPKLSGSTTPIQSAFTPNNKRRKFATKNCAECEICSSEVFEVCHPHISTIRDTDSFNASQGGAGVGAKSQLKQRNRCPICRVPHKPYEYLSPKGRRRIVLGSSTLHNLWKSKSYKPNFHIDFDCIIGGQIHDVHEAFLLQYKEVESPMDILLACGVNNIPTSDSAESIIFQFKSFVNSIDKHKGCYNEEYEKKFNNKIVICPILYAPKYCDKSLPHSDNQLTKVIRVNKWIQNFNLNRTGFHLNIDIEHGVKKAPEETDHVIHHIYDHWKEPSILKKLHLTPDRKDIIAKQVVELFKNLERQR